MTDREMLTRVLDLLRKWNNTDYLDLCLEIDEHLNPEGEAQEEATE